MRFVILLAVTLAAVNAKSIILGDDECTFGPSYWCKDLHTAKHCNAVKYCAEKVWLKHLKDSTCDTCKTYVTEIHTLLANNATQDAALQYMKNLCSELGAYAAQCKQYVSLYGKEIMELVVQYAADPAELCKMIGFCQGRGKPGLFQLWLRQFKGSTCDSCKSYVTEIHALLANNATQAEILRYMQNFCSELGSYAAECKMYVKQYGREILELVNQYTADPTAMCKMLGFCKGKAVPSLKMEKTSKPIVLGDGECTFGPSYWCKNAHTAKQCYAVKYCIEHVWLQKLQASSCDTCKQVVGIVHAYLEDNTTETEVMQALKALCSFLGAEATQCEQYVEKYGKAAMQLIAQYTANPAQVCTMIGMCKSKAVPFLKMKKASPVQAIDRVVFMPGPVMLQEKPKKTVKPKAGEFCQVCELVVGYMDNMLKNNATEQEIISALDSFCTYLPSSMKTECTTVVNTYAKQIIKMLASMSPELVCKELGLCTSKAKTVKLMKPKSSVTCELCEFAMSELDKILDSTTVEQEIVNAVEKLCSIMPTIVQGECKTLIDTYGKEIIQLLVDKLKPAQICKELKLCAQNLKIVQMKKPRSTVTCELCEFAMKELDNILKGSTVEQEIVNAVDKLCSVMPVMVQAECKSLVDSYGKMIIKLLVNQMEPSKICKEIKLCTQKLKLLGKPKVGKPQNVVTCKLCEVAMGYLDSYLKENATEQEIVAAVKKVCSLLPSQYQSECNTLISQYGTEIIQLLVNELKPSLICKSLGLCTSTKRKHLLSVGKPKIGKLQNPVICEVCEVAMGYLDSYLKENATEQEIVAAVEKVCSLLPSQYQSECNTLVAQYGTEIIQLLVNEMRPAVVCKAIGLCTSMKRKHLLSEFFSECLSTESTLKKPKNGVTCEFCEIAMGYLDKYLGDKATEKEIEAGVEKLCSYLPSAFKEECDAIISEYGKEIIDLLIKKKLKPAAVCKALGLCSSKKRLQLVSGSMIQKLWSKDLLAMSSKPRSAITCEVCELAMQYLDSLLKDNATEQQIILAVESLCSFLPSSVKTECDALIETYGKVVINLLVQELSPTVICKTLGLCQSDSIRIALKAKQVKRTAIDICSICKTVVSTVDTLIKVGKTEDEIIKAMDDVCSILGSYATECKSLVNEYGKAIINLLIAEIKPELVCKELGMCTSSRLFKNNKTKAVLA